MATKTERTKPGSKLDFRVTYDSGSKKWTNDRPGDGKGDPDEKENLFDDLRVKRGVDRLEKAISAYASGTGGRDGLVNAVKSLESYAGKDNARTAVRAVYRAVSDKGGKAAEAAKIAKDYVNRDRKASVKRVATAPSITTLERAAEKFGAELEKRGFAVEFDVFRSGRASELGPSYVEMDIEKDDSSVSLKFMGSGYYAPGRDVVNGETWREMKAEALRRIEKEFGRDRKKAMSISRGLVKIARELVASNPYKDMGEEEAKRAKEEMGKEFASLQTAARSFANSTKRLFPGAKLKSKKGFSTNFSTVYPYVVADVAPDRGRPFFEIRAVYDFHHRYGYGSGVALGKRMKYRAFINISRATNPPDFTSSTAKGAAKEAFQYLKALAEKHPDEVMKTLGIDPHDKPGAEAPTIREVESLVRKQSWFDVDDKSQNNIQFSTRANGDIGYEEPGRKDAQMANRMRKEILDKWGSNNVSVQLEGVDEWVHMTVELK